MTHGPMQSVKRYWIFTAQHLPDKNSLSGQAQMQMGQGAVHHAHMTQSRV